MKTIKRNNLLFILTGLVFIFLGTRYILVVITEKNLPQFKNHDHFVFDFEYFYEMGRVAFVSPRDLYKDPDSKGTNLVLLNKSVFHPYPPPASIIFRFFSFFPFAWAYLVWSVLIYAIAGISCIFFIRCIGINSNIKNDMRFPLLLCLSGAPTFLDSSFGNVNSALLFLCVFYCFLFTRKNYLLAGIVLSLAFWLKLYPVLLLLTGLFAQNKSRLLAGFFGGVIAVFLFTLNFLPFITFSQFFLEITPAYAHQTLTHAFNQSIIAAILRIISTPESYFSYNYILIPTLIRLMSYLILSIAVTYVLIVKMRYPGVAPVFVVAFICALIPLITPIGWGYTFVLTYPALLALYAMGAAQNRLSCLLYVLCWFAFAIPSYHRIENSGIPSLLRLLYYSRYTLSTIVITTWLGVQILQLQKRSFHSVEKEVVT